MKYKVFLALIIILSSNVFGQSKSPVVLKSLTDSFTYSESGFKDKFPIINGDTSGFGTSYYDNILKVSTETDSIAVHYNPKLKPYKQATLVHVVSSGAKKVIYLNFQETDCWFTNDYLQKAEHNVQYDIPETYELANVIYALTRSSAANNNRTLKGEYYNKVLSYFNKYKNHPLIKLVEFSDDVKGTRDYYNFRDNSFCFTINGGKVVSNNQYYFLWGELQDNLFARHIRLINDFYRKTNFHEFFQSNRLYYDTLVRRQRQLMPTQKMWQWLEKNFDEKIQSYRVVFSPLIKGSHGTQIFSWVTAPGNWFKEAVMFTSGTSGIDADEHVTERQKEGIASGILFTEIDHNYCNPVSERYQRQMDSALFSREKWVAKGGDTEGYPSPMAVFNEYITHAVYLLYASDNFKGGDFALIKENRENLMVERRKYIKFREFSDKLLQLYNERKAEQGVKDLFPMIIDWCKNQN